MTHELGKELHEFEHIWNRPVTRVGIATLLSMVLLSFLPNAYLYLRYGIFPPMPLALKAWGMVAAVYGAFYFVEPVSYFPVLGLSGTYMSFLAGNISNLRLPCSATAQEVVGVQNGTPEGEIISTLGIAGSIITNLVFVTLAAIAGYQLLALFPQPVADAFRTFSVPAIFGAIYGQFSLRYPLVGVIAMTIALVMFFAFHAPFWLVIIVSVFGTIAVSRVLYVVKWV